MPAVRDRQGLPVQGSAEAVDAYDRAIDHMLRLQIEMVSEAASTIEADPTFVMGYVLLAYMTLLSTDGGDVAGAQELAAAIDDVASKVSLSPREQAHAAVVQAWVAGDMAGAGRMLDDILVEHPYDILALGTGHQIDFFCGDAINLRDRVGRVLPAWAPEDPRFGFVLGMHTFGLEECNLYAHSAETGHRAVELNPDDVWGHHAVVHTYEMQGQIAEGVRFAKGRREHWAENNFLNVHNSWHYALFALQGADLAGVFDVYDTVLHHAESPDVALELVDATAMLWRLHLEDLDVGDRWEPVAAAWGRCLVPGHYPFNDMHATMAYLGAGEPDRAAELVGELERVAATAGDGSVTGARMTAAVGLPVCRGLVHFGHGDHAAALDDLLPIRHRFQEFGGSHAQRDALGRTIIEAARRADRLDLAQALLNERLSVRDASAYDWAKRAQVLAAAGDKQGAKTATARADALSSEIRDALNAA